ncbi:MAG: hypothetical protein AAF416_03875 [Pseudomonadota bacterium]
MTLEEVLDTLKAHAPSHKLDLPPDAFGKGSPVGRLLSAEVPNGGYLKVTVAELTIDEAKARVVLTGTGTGAPVTAMAVTAYFTVGAAGVEMALTATGGEDWTFASSYPQLATTFVETMAFTGATLTLDSSALPAFAVAQPGASVAPQVFSGKLGFAEDLSWLLGDKASLDISGAVSLQNGMPAFAFTVDTGDVDLPPLGTLSGTFSFAGKVESRTVEHIGGGSKTTVYETTLSLGVGAQIEIGSVEVALFLDLATGGLITVTAAFAAGKSIGLDDLAGITGGADLTSSLPPPSDYDPGSSFVLGELSLTVSPSQKRISSVSVTLTGAPQWPLFKNTTLSDVGVSFFVGNPGKQPIISASVFGDIAWPGGSLRGSSTYLQTPDSKRSFTLAIHLAEGASIDLTTVLDMLLKTDVPGNLKIDKLDLVFTPTSGDISLATEIDGDWPIDLGILTVSLEQAGLEIARTGGQTTGQIYARAAIGDAELTGVWTLPKDLRLTGALKKAQSLNTLIKTVTDITPPAGMPEISITEATATISVANTPAFHARRLAAGATVYDFSAKATASTEVDGKNVTLGTAFFEVRKAPEGFGFLAGFEVPAAWSPGELVPALGSVFEELKFKDTGVLISSIKTSDVQIPGLNLPALPDSIDPSIVVFTSLDLDGALKPVSTIFQGSVEFDLLGVLDLRTPLNSSIKASLRSLEKNNAIQFNSVDLTIKPGEMSVTLAISAIFNIPSTKPPTIVGSATVALKNGVQINISLVIEDWENPFDIPGLTIQKFGLALGLSEGQPTIGALGSFLIGRGADAFVFTIGAEIIDFEVPGAILFNLDSASGRTLMLSNMIDQFVPDLELSHVPVLSDVGFKRIDFLLVDDPAGFRIGDTVFPPGIRLDVDITLYDWEGILDVAVNQTKGIYAKGSISNPINIGDGFLVISDSSGKKGPEALIDTSAFLSGVALTDRQGFRTGEIDLTAEGRIVATGRSNLPVRVTAGAATYLELDASVTLLDVYAQTIKVAVATDRFEFLYEFVFLKVKEQLACSFSEAEKSFAASAAFAFDFKISTKALKKDGVTVVPPLNIDAPQAAFGLGIAFSWSSKPDGTLTVHIDFTWKSYNFHLDFTLTLADIEHALDNLWQAVKTWIANNLRTFLKPLIKNIETFVGAIKNGVLAFAHDALEIGKAIYHLFIGTVSNLAHAIAEALKTLGFNFAEIVEALRKIFNESADWATKIVSAIWGTCAMAGADQLMFGPMQGPVAVSRIHALPPRLLIDLRASDEGQAFLLDYYEHEAELLSLLSDAPVLDQRIEGAARAIDGAFASGRPLAPPLLEAMDLLLPHASDPLRERMIALKPAVEAMGDESPAEVLGRLRPHP